MNQCNYTAAWSEWFSLKWAKLIEPQGRMAGSQFPIRNEVENYGSHFISSNGKRDKNCELINLYKELSRLIS